MTHGHAKKHATSKTYNSWRAMIGRCYHPRNQSYRWYGALGVKVCDRWRGRGGFVKFLADLGERPEGMTLDRKDPEKDYSPDNCRWATAKAQTWNQRKRKVEEPCL